MRDLNLNTVCEEAACPTSANAGRRSRHGDDPWRRLHPRLRFLQRPRPGCARTVDPLEPENVAIAAGKMGLQHIVITSVDRDDLPRGGAGAVREGDPGAAP